MYNPALGAPQAQVQLASPEDVDAAVQAATDAFQSWGEASVTARARVMFALP